MRSGGALRIGRNLVVVGAALGLAACSSGPTSDDESDDALTSVTARSRALEFEGVVYVDRDASERTILTAAHRQTQSAFGALLNVDVSVKSRELKDVDPRTFKKREVKVVDSAHPGPGRTMLEVRYTFRDDAVVPVKLAHRTSLALALIAADGDDTGARSDIVHACTKDDDEARADARAGMLWYDFNPSKASCKKAIVDEQERIESDRAALTDPRHQIPLSQVQRSYLPATFSLTSQPTSSGATYPEYDRLFSGGVEPGKLVISMINGRLNHERATAAEDDGYYEWMDALGVIFEAHPGFSLTKIDPPEDLSAVTVGGRRIEALKFSDFIQWTVYDAGYPSGLTADQKKELRDKIGRKLDQHWLTFQMPVNVTIGNSAPKDFVIELDTLFGVDGELEPHKRAIRKSDVFVYDGHSYIGAGPLDPANFHASDFPDSYQLLFIDGCVSYNYYNAGYFDLKPGGSKNLDTITNGIEAPEYESGAAEGRLLAQLVDGRASYRTLLTAARATDPLRVVDGESDNKYSPDRTPIRVEAR